MLDNYPQVLTPKEVKQILRIGYEGLKALDDELKPAKIGSRKDRRYIKKKLIKFIKDNHE